MLRAAGVVKRRRQSFRRIYQHLEHWQALREDRGMDDTITAPDGEEVYMGDLLAGLGSLPPRQREAFDLICLQGYTEKAAREKLSLGAATSCAPVQQYADRALRRMIDAYDAKQLGRVLPEETDELLPVIVEKTRKERKPKVTNDIVRAHLQQARDELVLKLAQAEEEAARARDGLAEVDALLKPSGRGKQPVRDVARQVIEAEGG